MLYQQAILAPTVIELTQERSILLHIQALSNRSHGMTTNTFSSQHPTDCTGYNHMYTQSIQSVSYNSQRAAAISRQSVKPGKNGALSLHHAALLGFCFMVVSHQMTKSMCYCCLKKECRFNVLKRVLDYRAESLL